MSEIDELELIQHKSDKLFRELANWRKRNGSIVQYRNILLDNVNSAFYSGKASQENWENT